MEPFITTCGYVNYLGDDEVEGAVAEQGFSSGA